MNMCPHKSAERENQEATRIVEAGDPRNLTEQELKTEATQLASDLEEMAPRMFMTVNWDMSERRDIPDAMEDTAREIRELTSHEGQLNFGEHERLVQLVEKGRRLRTMGRQSRGLRPTRNFGEMP